jgi:hypothetical protein
LRTYVLQHVETTEHSLELLRDLAAVNPPAFAEAWKTFTAQGDELRAQRLAEVHRMAAAIEEKLAPLVGYQQRTKR